LRSILLAIEAGAADLLVSELSECGTTGILEEAGGLRAFFSDDADISELLVRHRDLILDLRSEQPIDWQQVSREGWDPITVGQRFFVVPPWVKQPTPEGRMRLVFDSMMAFGTGRHESTQLAIEALEAYVQPGQTVVDIGCGTGILSKAAEMLGAARVFACDVDPNAASEAHHHLGSRVFVGSVDAIRTAVADVVCANITAPVLERIGSELSRICKSEGIMILAGFIAEDLPHVFKPERTLTRGDWVCWIVSGSCAPKDAFL
jgi:ribosomal protein L11 methyltransferase